MTAPLVFLLAVSGDDYRPSVSALARLSAETLHLIRQRRTAYTNVGGADAALYEMYYWDPGAITFLNDGSCEDDSPPTAPEASAAESLAWLLAQEGHDVMSLDAPTASVVSEHRAARVECAQMIIGRSGVRWMAYPKHSEGEMRTAEIPWGAMGMEVPDVE